MALSRLAASSPAPRTLSPPLRRLPLPPPPPALLPLSSRLLLPGTASGGRARWLRGGVTESPGLGKAAGSEPETPSWGRVSGRRRARARCGRGEPVGPARWAPSAGAWRAVAAGRAQVACAAAGAGTSLRRPGRPRGAVGGAAGWALGAGNGRWVLGMGREQLLPSAAGGRRSGKSCAGNNVSSGSRREPCSPAVAGWLRTAARGSRAQLSAGLQRAWHRALGAAQWSPLLSLVCGVWVALATDVSCFSKLDCIFVGSSVIWSAGWRRWAWSGEDRIWDGRLEPTGWAKD